MREFKDYVPLADALALLKRSVRSSPRREPVTLEESFGRLVYDDVVSRFDIPPADSSHMDGFAVRASDLSGASEADPVLLKVINGSPLGVLPSGKVAKNQAYPILTGGYLPAGADAVIQSEAVSPRRDGTISVPREVERGEFVFSKGRDVRKGETVIRRGRQIRGTDMVLLASLHMDKVGVYRRPRVAVIPTGNELSARIRGTEPGKVVETHSLLLSRLIDGAGGVPVPLPIARDDVGDIAKRIRQALASTDLVLTLAGSSVGEPDVTETAISRTGRPGVLVHGMRVFRGRVMGFGAIDGTGIVILPGPIQGAMNAFALMAYPVIRSFLGEGFQEPPSLPAVMGSTWEAGGRYSDFTKVVYVRLRTGGAEIVAEPSKGETEKVTHLTQNDGYVIVEESSVRIGKGAPVRVHLLPGLSGPPPLPS